MPRPKRPWKLRVQWPGYPVQQSAFATREARDEAIPRYKALGYKIIECVDAQA